MDLKPKAQIPNPEARSRKPEAESDEPRVALDAYCRNIEAYLCRKNDGHLIRIVGPSFERVRGWAERGVPIQVAFRGIDRYFDRYYAKGPRRRPVQIDFCEADVLDGFDEWRLAVGVWAASGAQHDDGAEADGGEVRHRQSLPAHLDRVIARLTALRAGGDRALDPVIEGIVREIDAARAGARGMRGPARAEFLSRLAELDRTALAAVRQRLGAPVLASIRREAEDELAPFRARMPHDAYERALAACTDRLIREHAKLPVLTLS